MGRRRKGWEMKRSGMETNSVSHNLCVREETLPLKRMKQRWIEWIGSKKRIHHHHELIILKKATRWIIFIRIIIMRKERWRKRRQGMKEKEQMRIEREEKESTALSSTVVFLRSQNLLQQYVVKNNFSVSLLLSLHLFVINMETYSCIWWWWTWWRILFLILSFFSLFLSISLFSFTHYADDTRNDLQWEAK